MTKGRRLTPVAWKDVTVADGFWGPRVRTNRRVTLPLEYDLNRKNGVLEAFAWDWWDRAKGNPPWRITVGDLGKWIEAASYSLAQHPDVRLARKLEHAVGRIVAGQKPDGYIYSNPLPREWRWARLESWHEFYETGHEIEGAVAHWQATGDRRFLDAVCRAANLIEANFGTEPGKRRGYDGHPEIELALVKLFRATGEPRYLKLAKFFIDERGRKPNYFLQERQKSKKLGLGPDWWTQPGGMAYMQAHRPLREQKDAVGHAVRALYLYSGMADVAAETGDKGLLTACRRLWDSVTRRRMYVIGAVGSSGYGERFTFDYDLPNETAYGETCAAIALVFFAHRMLQIDADGAYADVMERALYNGVLSGISLDGKRFFYENRLAVYPRPKGQGVGNPGGDGDTTSRKGWFGCACCPPNIARLIASIGGYAYSTSPDAAWIHLYIGGDADLQVDGQRVRLRQETGYPWKENARITVEPERPGRFALMLRVPGWCRKATFKVNGKTIRPQVTKGYARLLREWSRGDRVDLTLAMPVERIEARPQVRMDCGKVALQRGPVVYCLEEIDNGKDLADLALLPNAPLKVQYEKTLGGAAVLVGNAVRRAGGDWGDALYRPVASRTRAVPIKAVPYCLWNNRGPGEMLVWVRAG